MDRKRQFAQAAAMQQADATRAALHWVALAAVSLALLAAAAPARSQTVPEIVRPRSDAPALPANPADGPATRPRSENPQADGGGVRPIPDGGVIAPPVSGLGSTTVIRPPAQGAMPVIPPPGSPGGDTKLIPK